MTAVADVLLAVVAALRRAVQGVAAVAVLLVLVAALVLVLVLVLVATLVTLVTLLPRTMRAGGAHARGLSREGEGQERRWLTLWGRWRRGRTFGLPSSSILPLVSIIAPSPPLAQAQSLQGGAGGPPGQAVGGVALEGELELALLGRDEAACSWEVHGDDGGALTCEGG